ncbi:hypothetical protein IFR05_005551 [Cadophora sp. M221]|nr:hypothetical protein IFR05_005551 [Cadophora sp. M221]
MNGHILLPSGVVCPGGVFCGVLCAAVLSAVECWSDNVVSPGVDCGPEIDIDVNRDTGEERYSEVGATAAVGPDTGCMTLEDSANAELEAKSSDGDVADLEEGAMNADREDDKADLDDDIELAIDSSIDVDCTPDVGFNTELKIELGMNITVEALKEADGSMVDDAIEKVTDLEMDTDTDNTDERSEGDGKALDTDGATDGSPLVKS